MRQIKNGIKEICLCAFAVLTISYAHSREPGKQPNIILVASSVRLGNTADRAVDGITNDSSMAMTDVGISPWIEIDLEREVVIDKIRVYNREGQLGKQLDHVVVKVLDSNPKEVFAGNPMHAAVILGYGVK